MSFCRHVPFVIISEQPDGTAANTRKKAKSQQGTPPNSFHLNGFCAAHQVHRFIQLHEDNLIGNVHVIAFASGSPTLQGKFQVSMLSILDGLNYRRGEPNPEHVFLNKMAVRHTLRRREDCVTSDPHRRR